MQLAPELKKNVFNCATQVAYSASELIALTRVLASVLGTHLPSQERVISAVQFVTNSISELIVKASCQFSNTTALPIDQRKKYDQLLSTANFTNNALHQLLSEIHQLSLKSKK